MLHFWWTAYQPHALISQWRQHLKEYSYKLNPTEVSAPGLCLRLVVLFFFVFSFLQYQAYCSDMKKTAGIEMPAFHEPPEARSPTRGQGTLTSQHKETRTERRPVYARDDVKWPGFVGSRHISV